MPINVFLRLGPHADCASTCLNVDSAQIDLRLGRPLLRDGQRVSPNIDSGLAQPRRLLGVRLQATRPDDLPEILETDVSKSSGKNFIS
jgi:hypothetical protein